jgi:predicted TIM-barrel fold metal-dependent hydrolase
VALIPFRSPSDAIAEIKRAKELGAVGLFTLGTAGENMLDERVLDPVWDEVEKQALPVCIHVGWSVPGLTRICKTTYASFCLSFTLPGMIGLFAITGGGVLDRHPGLRFSFLEFGGDWLPYFLDRFDRYHGVVTALKYPVSQKPPSEYLKTGQIYFSVEGDEPMVPKAIELIGGDHVMASADMPHAEAREGHMDEIAGREDIPVDIRTKILWDNTLRFYNLKV